MLDKIDLSKKMDKEAYKRQAEGLMERLPVLQRELRSLNVPVVIVFEGVGAAGKGTQINRLIQPLDPRGFHVYAINGESEEEHMRPFLWRFWTKMPEKGRIAIFDRSWYRKVLVDRYEKVTPKTELDGAFEEISSFEKQLTDDGALVLKFFLCISEKEQKKRYKALMDNKETAWRVSEADWDRHKHFDKYLRINDEMLQKTDTENAPWVIVEAVDREYATIKICQAVVKAFEEKIEAVKNAPKPVTDGKFDNDVFRADVLNKADLTKAYTKEEYKRHLKELQDKLRLLHSRLYLERVPVVLAFEGWDAGGKGGAIKRLTEAMDPRGYRVNPTSAPNDIEKAHHYLWRFWNNVPKDGHVAIFDRTWYGRVMVERIEGFCDVESWSRAYKEINQMEGQFASHGAIVLKFWMQIDKDEQERRFKERMENPLKSWKITDEDWRNREKWDLYVQAVDEMILRTSTTYAPWIIVEGNDKYYARIKVLRTVVDAIEAHLCSRRK